MQRFSSEFRLQALYSALWPCNTSSREAAPWLVEWTHPKATVSVGWPTRPAPITPSTAAVHRYDFHMASSFQCLFQLLVSYEREQFGALSVRCLDEALKETLKGAAHGDVQFAALEPGKETARSQSRSCSEELLPGDEKVLPVVVAVGINYWQNSENPTFPSLNPCLVDPANGTPTVIDPEFPHKAWRRAVGKTIAACQRNRQEWMPVDGRRPHASNVALDPQSDCILIATNFCPLVTLKAWDDLGQQEHEALLKAMAEMTHLRSLLELLGDLVDLWIGHGKKHCWPHFDQFRQESGVTSWLLANNLSHPECVVNAELANTDRLYRLDANPASRLDHSERARS